MKTRTVHALPPRLPVVTVMRLEAEVLDDLEPLGDELVRAAERAPGARRLRDVVRDLDALTDELALHLAAERAHRLGALS